MPNASLKDEIINEIELNIKGLSPNRNNMIALIKNLCNYIEKFNDPSILEEISKKDLNIFPYLIKYSLDVIQSNEDSHLAKNVYGFAVKALPQFVPRTSWMISEMISSWGAPVYKKLDKRQLGLELYEITIQNRPDFINDTLPLILTQMKAQPGVWHNSEVEAFEKSVIISPEAVARTIPLVVDLFSNKDSQIRMEAAELYGLFIQHTRKFLQENEFDAFFTLMIDEDELVRKQASCYFGKITAAAPSLIKLTQKQIAKLSILFLNWEIPSEIMSALHRVIEETSEMIPPILELIKRTFLDLTLTKFNSYNNKLVFNLFKAILEKHQLKLDFEEQELLYAQFTHPDKGKREKILAFFDSIIETYPEAFKNKVQEKLEVIKQEMIEAEPLSYNFSIESFEKDSRLITEKLINAALEVISIDSRPLEKGREGTVLAKKRSPWEMQDAYNRAIAFLEICIQRTPHFIPHISEFSLNLLASKYHEVKLNALRVYDLILTKAPETITENDLNRIFEALLILEDKIFGGSDVRPDDSIWMDIRLLLNTCDIAIKIVPQLINKAKVESIQKMFKKPFRDSSYFSMELGITCYTYNVNIDALYAYESIIKSLPHLVDQTAIDQIIALLKEPIVHPLKEPDESDDSDELWRGFKELDESDESDATAYSQEGLRSHAYHAFMVALKYTPNYIQPSIPVIMRMRIDYGRFLKILKEAEKCRRVRPNEFQDPTFLYNFIKELLKLILPMKDRPAKNS